MSYDIRIVKSDDPHGGIREAIDVHKVVQAINTHPPFAARGITWANRKWSELSEWKGMTIDLEGHDPERIAPGCFDEEAGLCDACELHVSYGSDSNLEKCVDLSELPQRFMQPFVA